MLRGKKKREAYVENHVPTTPGTQYYIINNRHNKYKNAIFLLTIFTRYNEPRHSSEPKQNDVHF